jgi:hypothetical protein
MRCALQASHSVNGSDGLLQRNMEFAHFCASTKKTPA